MDTNPFSQINGRLDNLERLLLDLKYASTKTEEEEEQLLKVPQVCEILQVCKSTLHNWCKTGVIKVHRIGSRIFFKRSEIISSSHTIRKYHR